MGATQSTPNEEKKEGATAPTNIGAPGNSMVGGKRRKSRKARKSRKGKRHGRK